jgi:hypothetical protein
VNRAIVSIQIAADAGTDGSIVVGKPLDQNNNRLISCLVIHSVQDRP